MERITSDCMRLCVLAVYISILATTHFTTQCDARTLPMFMYRGQEFHKSPVIDAINNLDMNPPTLHTSNDELVGLSSPFSLVPFQSLAPLPSPEKNTPPFCAFPPQPPPPPPPPHTGMPSPTPSSSYGQPISPTPPFFFTPTFPHQSPPPPGNTPTPPILVPNPPHSVPSPPRQVPSPPKHAPSPPVVVNPPPSGPPPPHKGAVWCVAKPTVPNPIIQEAMDYACGSGADCKSIQPNGSCFKPNTVIAHASYAFNSYWQKTKVAGGTCDFGGSAMLVTIDPSFDGCKFIYD